MYYGGGWRIANAYIHNSRIANPTEQHKPIRKSKPAKQKSMIQNIASLLCRFGI